MHFRRDGESAPRPRAAAVTQGQAKAKKRPRREPQPQEISCIFQMFHSAAAAVKAPAALHNRGRAGPRPRPGGDPAQGGGLPARPDALSASEKRHPNTALKSGVARARFL